MTDSYEHEHDHGDQDGSLDFVQTHNYLRLKVLPTVPSVSGNDMVSARLIRRNCLMDNRLR